MKHNIVYKGLLLIIMTLTLSSCATSNSGLPISENETGIKRNGEFVWVDLVTNNAELNTTYFEELLGWEVKKHRLYNVAYSGTKPIAGIIEEKELSKDSISSYWVLSASVKDVDATISKVKENGGKVLAEKITIPGRGETAIIEDKQEAYFSIMNNPMGDLKASAAKNNEWLWAELWTSDLKNASDFYKNVLSCEVYSAKDKEGSYYVLKGEKYDFAGIVETPLKKEKPIWIPVLKVENTVKLANKAKQLGGHIIIKPTKVSGEHVALITTPDGAPFLIQQRDN